MRRIPMGFAVPVTGLALVLAGCTSQTGAGSSPSASSSGGEKQQLTLAQTVDFYGWDPSNQPGFQGWAAEAVWDNLCKTDANGKAQPDLADKFEVTNGNKTFKAHIREGQKFSDGTPVDSAAVKADFDYASKNGGGQADYKGIKIETPDANNISITWPEAQGPVIDNKACNPKIMPASFLAAKKFDKPVGSGPYVLDTAASTTGSVYTFTKNENHWNAKNYPYKKLVIKVITSDTAAVSALKTGQIDAVLVAQPSVAQVEASPNTKVVKFQGQTTRLLLTDHLGKSIPAIGNLKVRQAINMVFDKAAMAKSLYQGNAEPTGQVFRKGTDAYIDGLQDPYPFDVAKAKSLMAEAGYADGFTLNLPTMTGQNFETLMPYVTQQLAQLNIKVKQVPLTGANAIGDLLSGKYPVVLWQLGNLGNSALQIYVESTPAGWWDLMHQPDQYVDSRWKQITTADPQTAAKLQKEINQYQVDQAWFAPMVYMGTNYAYNSSKVSIPTESDQEALTPKLRDFK
jgi:peptide/nickel transport system substrate-binding protein